MVNISIYVRVMLLVFFEVYVLGLKCVGGILVCCILKIVFNFIEIGVFWLLIVDIIVGEFINIG